jgi:hypothetical protein
MGQGVLRAVNPFSASASPRLASPHLGVVLPEKCFFAKRSQILPVFIEDLEKTNPNNVITKPKKEPG